MSLQNNPDTSYAFISYHHSDNEIAASIRTELFRLAEKGRGRSCLSCFLDSHPRSITPGERWEPIIRDNVEVTDWLVCIYTGDQSAYCGFEVGAFSLRNGLGSNSPAADKRLICLYDVTLGELPILFSPYQNEQIIRDTSIDVGDMNTWWNSPVGRFLHQFCSYRQLYTPLHGDNPAQYTIDIANSAAIITKAFNDARRNDTKEETQCQLNFQVKVASSAAEITSIPDESVVISTSLTFDILNLNLALSEDKAPRISWGELREKICPANRQTVPWMDKFDADAVRSANKQTIANDDVSFIGRNGRVYRTVLVRHKLYENGARKFYGMFVETLDRRFAGRRETSLLLISLIVASRLRFTYFENWQETKERRFGKTIPLAEFRDSVKQLQYNLDMIEHESIDYGLDDPTNLIAAFGPERRARVERFYSDYQEAKNELITQSGTSHSISSEADRDNVRGVILTFLEKVKAQNAEFLELCIDAYSREILVELKRST
jgi:hypothetical protein